MSDLPTTIKAEPSMMERYEDFIGRDDALDQVCSFIASGGSLPKLAELLEVRHGDLSNWLHKDKDRSQRYIKAMNDRSEYDREIIVDELKKVAMIDIRKVFKPDGSMLPVDQWPEEIAKAVSSVEVFEEFEGKGEERHQIGWTKRVKFWDKTKALDMLGRSHGMFIDRKEVSGNMTLGDLIMQSMVFDSEE